MDLSFICIEFEHSLENEIINQADPVATRKAALVAYKYPSQSNTSSPSINKQRNVTEMSPQTNSPLDDSKSPSTSRKNFRWNHKSASKDG